MEIETIRSETKISNIIECCALVFISLTTLCIIGWALKYSQYGFDVTDEGFYLAWISQPFIYKYSVSQFGYIYHPLFKIVGEDIVLLRQANILITYFLGWATSHLLIHSVLPDLLARRVTAYIISASIATGSLLAVIIAGGWVATPSYNTLALQSLLIVAIGMLLADDNYSKRSWIGWILIGIGGWLAFMAKPSTAAALAVCVAIYLLIFRIRIGALAIMFVATLSFATFSSIIIDGNIEDFFNRLTGGIALSNYLGGGYSFSQVLRLGELIFNELEITALTLLTFIISLIILCINSKLKPLRLFAFTLLAAIFSLILIVVFGKQILGVHIGPSQELLVWAFPFSALLAVIATHPQKTWTCFSSKIVLILCIFAIFPYVYVFGTNNNYWTAAGPASYFWILAGTALVTIRAGWERSWLTLAAFALATQAFVAVRIQNSLENPYRQPQALFLNNYPLEIGKSKIPILLETGYGEYLHQIIAAAQSTNFKPETPVIDLSGQSPGVLYTIGAVNIGQAWMIGGYPGSFALAQAALKHVSCDQLAKAWVLVEPSGPRSLSEDLVMSFGADFANDYQIRATWQTAKGVGGYQELRTQHLLDPIRSQIIARQVCEKLRGENN